MKSFQELGLQESLITALEAMKIVEPTAIQELIIPLLLAGQNVIGQAPTGTGKTLAYLLPLLAKIDETKQVNQAVILAPTYELAAQVQRVATQIITTAGLNVKTALLLGSGNIARQVEKLKTKPQLIVGSSVRILDLIHKKKIQSQSIRMIVLDEADRLLSNEHLASSQAIIQSTLKDRQIIACSATFAAKTLNQAKVLMEEPVVVQTSERPTLPDSLTHNYFAVARRDKFDLLRRLLQLIKPAQALVFADNPVLLSEITEKLQFHGVAAEGLYGSKNKEDRKKAVINMQQGKSKILVASDVAARGLDFPSATHVFQLDFPDTPHVYLHRAGRTGRNGQAGTVISLVTNGEAEKLKVVAKTLKISLQEQKIVQGRIVDATKEREHGKI